MVGNRQALGVESIKENLSLQIPAGRHRHHYVKAKVSVHEYPDGDLAVFHGPRCLARLPRLDGTPIESSESRRLPPPDAAFDIDHEPALCWPGWIILDS